MGLLGNPNHRSSGDVTPSTNCSLAARVLTELVHHGYFTTPGGPDDTAGSDKLIVCLGELGSHALGLLEVSNAVAASRHVAAMQWLCSRQTQLTCAASTCAAAARSGSVPMLEFLTSPQVSCPWDSDLYEEASRGGHIAFLEYLRDEDYQWTQDRYLQCLHAARDAGQEGVISWLFSQKPPGEWTPASCLRASHCGIAALLPWLAADCPKWTRKHCHKAALMQPSALFHELDQGGPNKPWAEWQASDLIDRASQGEYDVGRLATELLGMTELCVAAAKCGQLGMLKWLFGEKRQRDQFYEVFHAAVEADQPHVLQYLTDIGLIPCHAVLYRAGPKCLLLWAKTGRPMRDRFPYQVIKLVESWYTLQGWYKWARSPWLSWPEKTEMIGRPATQSRQKCLLELISDLPEEVFEKICDGALLSPADAKSIP